ncbi:MAG: ATP-binding cassette domain-containing protein, partial [Acinetobacter sp.]
DRVMVLYAGHIAEDAPLHEIFNLPRHPYTQGLLNAIPDVVIRKDLTSIEGQAPSPKHRPEGCAFAPRCHLATEICQKQPQLLSLDADPSHFVACHHDLTKVVGINAQSRIDQYITGMDRSIVLELRHIDAWYGQHQVLHDISLALYSGECLALVGESGSGKTTLSRIIAGLNIHAEGALQLANEPLSIQVKQREMDQRRKLQYIFQNPYKALNPAQTVGEILSKVVQHFFALPRSESMRKVDEILFRVSLPLQLRDAYPRDLSGGERQRVAIARALLCQPDVLICDEITSALDVSVQASILKLLQELQQQGVTLLFVTHNLGVVRAIADRVAVLKHGQIVEYGETDQVLSDPQHRYTKLLLEHAPSMLKAKAEFAEI